MRKITGINQIMTSLRRILFPIFLMQACKPMPVSSLHDEAGAQLPLAVMTRVARGAEKINTLIVEPGPGATNNEFEGKKVRIVGGTIHELQADVDVEMPLTETSSENKSLTVEIDSEKLRLIPKPLVIEVFDLSSDPIFYKCTAQSSQNQPTEGEKWDLSCIKIVEIDASRSLCDSLKELVHAKSVVENSAAEIGCHVEVAGLEKNYTYDFDYSSVDSLAQLKSSHLQYLNLTNSCVRKGGIDYFNEPTGQAWCRCQNNDTATLYYYADFMMKADISSFAGLCQMPITTPVTAKKTSLPPALKIDPATSSNGSTATSAAPTPISKPGN